MRIALLRVLVVTSMVVAVSRAHAQSANATAAPITQAGVPAPGVDAVLDARVKAIASRLRCPVCQGESIQDSPAELSAQMKALVREQLAHGKSDGEVMDYFVQKYGQWILLEPKPEGINLLVYWLPVAFLACGAGVIVFAVRKWTRPVSVATARDAEFHNDVRTESVE